MVREDWIHPQRSRATVGEVATVWLKSLDWKDTTRARNRGVLNRHVLPRGAPSSSRMSHMMTSRHVGTI